MRKGKLYISILLGLCLCLFTAFGVACKDENSTGNSSTGGDSSTEEPATPTLESISVSGETEVFIDEFDYADYTITATYSDNSTKTATLTADNLSADDNAKLSTVGTHALTVSYESVTCSWTITLKNHDFAGITFDDITTTYDGTAKTLAVAGLPTGAQVSYDKATSYTNAGEYTVKATITLANYNPVELTATLTINKATYDMSTVVFEDKTVTYNGQAHSIEATNLPNGVTAQYTGNSQINAGEYEIKATFTGDSQNYELIASQTATLTINKATYDMSGVVFKDKSVNYTGEAYSIEATNLPEGVSATYDGNNQTQAGEYTITAHFTGDRANYNAIPDMTATLKINASDLTGVSFHDGEFTYDGTKKSIYITSELPDGVKVDYTNNEQINANSYTVTATFTCTNGNYTNLPELTATLTIKKAVYDMSAVIFEDKTVTYDGQAHSILATNLPNGVTAQYTGDKQINAGEYEITATFTGDSQNYELIASQTATLTIEQRELTLAFNGETTLKYNGKAQKTITVQATNLVDGDSVELTVSYNGTMIEAGEYIATATLTAHQNYKLTANNTVKVKITRATHTVTFKQNGFADVTREVLDLADLTDIPTPQHVDGYKFTWNRTDFTSITEDITVTANKELITYKIEYVVYDGVNSVSNPTTYTVENATFTLKNPTTSETFGKSFGGWFTSPDFSLDSKITKIEKGSFGDLKLYAYWLEYRVTEVVGGTVDYSQSTPEITIKVDYGTANLAVKDLISVSDGCTWKLYTGFECLPTQELTAKRLSVSNIGDNIFYILVFHPDSDEYYTDYVLNVYQLDMKAYTFLKDGETWASGEIQEESALNAPENPEKDGYTFDGWSVDGTIVSFPYTVLTGTVFTAEYTPIEYTVIFRGEQGNVVNPERKYTIETGMIFEIPTRDYYEFTGWCESETHDGAFTGIEIGTWGDYEFYATWTPVEYDITYELNGGTDDTENPKQYTIETETITLAEPTKTGYGFKGWYLEETLKTRVYTIEKGSHGDKTFYAKWGKNTNTLKFDGNGATSGATSDMEIKTAETKALIANGFDKTGYTFIGWATSANGDVVYTDGASYTMGINAEYTLYAKWQANLNTLKFDGNGATGGSTAQMSIYTDETKALTANGFVKAGYTFIGWVIEADGEVVYTDGASYTMGVNTEYTLYAKWQANLNTLKFNGNGYTNGSMSSMTIATDSTATLNANKFVHTGYTFIGWATSADGEVVYTDCADYTMGTESSYTLYAIWEANLNTIYFDGNGATGGEMSSVQARTGETITLPLNIYTNTSDYTYTGWAKTVSGSMAYTDGASYTVGTASEQTLYAYWKRQTASGFVWSVSSGKVSITDYVGTDAEIAIPETIIGYNVTSIGSSAFRDCSSLTSIEIPDSVTSIGSSAFSGCSSLKKIELPFVGSGRSNISDYGELLFGYIFGNTSYVGGTATKQYYKDSSYKTYYIPSALKSVAVKGGYIRYGAFYNCSGLTSVAIGNRVESIGYEAFRYCSSLTGVYITDIEAWCNISFEDNDANPLNNGANLYLNNELVTELEIPNTITEIKDYAFWGCSSLTSVVIPDSVTSIGEYAFEYCDSLTSIIVAENNTTYASQDGILYNKQKTECIYIPKSITGSVTIPDGITSIGSSAFSGCSSLTSIEIPESVTSIGDSAFYGCSSLTSVEIPDGVTSIGSFAFYNCSNLTSIKIPDTVTSIGSYAFSGCSSLTSISIPNSVTSIGESAFYNCSSLIEMTIPFVGKSKEATGRESVFGYIFGYEYATKSDTTISGATYQYYDENWGNYYHYFIPTTIEKVTVLSGAINDNAFRNCSNLMSVELFDNVVSIGLYSFLNCDKLESFVISNGITSIGDYAFYSCNNLSVVVIGKNVVTIGNSVFKYCNSLTSITVSNDNTKYAGQDGILYNKAKTSFIHIPSAISGEVKIPNGITSIGDSVFESRQNLTKIEIPNSVISIGEGAFSYCRGLTRIEIPNSVTSIGEGAFRGCNSLESMVLPFTGSSNSPSAGYESVFGYIFGYKKIKHEDAAGSPPVVEGAIRQYSEAVSYEHTMYYYYYIPLSLRSVTITGGHIPYWAFANCINLDSIVLGVGVTSIGSYAFDDNSSLTIYCEAECRPSTWNYNWNNYNNAVYWYSATEPTASGNYWRYVDGVVTIW